MATELSADIILRTQQVDKKLKETGQRFRGFAEAAKQAGVGAGAALDGIPKKLDRVNHKVGRSSIIWFQAGQAISDFAVAGVLGAANNIEFLAAQMGIGGPLIAGIAVTTTAFLVFRDEISSALDPVGQRVKELKEGVEDVFEVLNKPGFKVGLLANQVGPALDEQIKKVDALKGALNSLQFGIKPTPEVQAVIDQFKTIGDLNAELARQKTGLEAIRGEYESILNAANAQAALLTNSFIQQNQEAGLAIRRRITELGLSKELGDTSDLQLLSLERQGKLEEFIANLQKKKTGSKREELTELDRAIKANERLKERLEALRNVDNSRLGLILMQNQRLEDQIKVVQRLNAERAKQGGGLGIPGLTGLTPAGAETSPQPIGELIEDLKKRAAQERKQLLDPRGLGQGALDFFEQATAKDEEVIEAMRGIAEGTNQTAEAFRKAGIDAHWFYTQTEEGTLRLMDATSQLAGGISNAFYQAFQASGESQKGFFKAFKAFGIAEAVISTYVAANKALAEGGPILGPIMAAAMVAQGLANVARIKAVQPGGASAAGGGITTSSLPPGRIDPREGRRFRRGYEPEAPGSMTLLDKLNSIGDQFTFRLQGEDLVASADATYTRQNRTRNIGTASTRGVGR